MDFLVRVHFQASQSTLSRKNGPSGNGVSVPAAPFAWRSKRSSTFGIATWLGLFAPSMKKRIKAGEYAQFLSVRNSSWELLWATRSNSWWRLGNSTGSIELGLWCHSGVRGDRERPIPHITRDG